MACGILALALNGNGNVLKRERRRYTQQMPATVEKERNQKERKAAISLEDAGAMEVSQINKVCVNSLNLNRPCDDGQSIASVGGRPRTPGHPANWVVRESL